MQRPSPSTCPPEQVKLACGEVNEIVSRRKDVEQLLALRERLVGLPNSFKLMQLDRKLIREGQLCVVSFMYSHLGTHQEIFKRMHARAHIYIFRIAHECTNARSPHCCLPAFQVSSKNKQVEQYFILLSDVLVRHNHHSCRHTSTLPRDARCLPLNSYLPVCCRRGVSCFQPTHSNHGITTPY